MIYDKAYRRRALEYWGEEHTRKETAEVFKVDPSTLQRWKSRLKETGNLETQKGVQPWKKIEPARLKDFLEQHPDAYLKEMAEEFACSETAILKALRRLKISRKKNHTLQGD